MNVTFRTFNVGKGDCITLLLQKEEQEIHILVDCGKYTDEVNDFIEKRFFNKIDYLIVTHIDNDHIVGIINILRKTGIEIHHIIYNCYQRVPNNPQQWDTKMKNNILGVMNNLPIVVDMLEYKISAEKARTLAETILTNKKWKNIWQREYITDQSTPIELSNNMGKIIFLSPTQGALDNIDHLYRKLFWKKLFKRKIEDYNEESTIYETLLRLSQLEIEEDIIENISSKNLNKETLVSLSNKPLGKISSTNEASIAFIWEKDEHRILFMGDASPKQIYDSLNKLYSTTPKPILFDVIKISHHGSANNTTNELINVADSKQYFFTGKTESAPSINTIARIVTAPLSEKIPFRTLNYNQASKNIKELEKYKDLQEELNFKLLNHNQYEFSC